MGIKNFPVKAGPCPSLHRPPSLLEKYIFFALPSMNGPLPAELKFRENTVFVIGYWTLLRIYITEQSTCLCFRWSYSSEIIPLSLCVFLDGAKQCLCGNYCFASCIHHIVTINIQQLAHTVVSVCSTQNHIPAEGFLCSRKCLQRLQSRRTGQWR